MFNGNCGYSLADIAAATGNTGRNSNGSDGMWNDGGAWWIIILFLFVFCGWGGNGFGNGFGGGNGAGLQGALTRADLCQDMNFQGLENGVRGIQQGLCDGFYAMNTGMLNGFAGVNNAICNLGYEQATLANGTNVALMQGNNALQAQLADCCCTTKGAIKDAQFANQAGQTAIQTQLASCCCDIERQVERGFADTRYDMATNTCALKTQMANDTRDIIDSQNAGTRAILDYLCQEKIADLQTENQNLKLAASQAAQNNYLVSQLRPCPQPAYLTCNPFTGQTYGGGCYGYNSGCGCGNNF